MPRRSKGYSLIELISVLAIMGLVFTAAYSVFYSSQRTYAAQDQVVAMQQSARNAIDLLTQELRMAGYDPHPNHIAEPKARIVQATSNLVQFRADLNGNGTTDQAADVNEQITYSFTGTTLSRNASAGFQRIADNIVALQFTYFLIADGSFYGLGAGVDDDGDGRIDQPGELLMTTDPGNIPAVFPGGLTPLEAIRMIRITLAARTALPDPSLLENGGFRQYTLTADVAPRNIAYVK